MPSRLITTPNTSISENLESVITRIRLASEATGRNDDVTLVAVTKTLSEDPIKLALAAGQRTFGENRVQEAQAKWPSLKASYSDIRLHLIGPLQTNKIRAAVSIGDVIETVDRPKVARALAIEIERSGRSPDCYVQVNIGEEPQKSGVLPNEADDFIVECCRNFQLPVKGLMCIPPNGQEPSLYFALLRKIARRNGLPRLSMGMSHDFETAIDFGSTEVRIGTAIFGARSSR